MNKILITLCLLLIGKISYCEEFITPITTENKEIMNNTVKNPEKSIHSEYLLTEYKKESPSKRIKKNESIKREYLETSKNRVIKDSCDLIIFLNGDEIYVRELELNENRVKYIKCQDSSQVTYTKEMNEIFLIKYRNGEQETFSQEHYPTKVKKKKKIKKEELDEYEDDYLAIMFLGFVCGFFLFLLGMLVALGFEKGPKRKAFFKGLIIGIIAMIVLRAVLVVLL